MRTRLSLALTAAALIVASVAVGRTQGRGTAQTPPAVPQITNNPRVDQAAHDRGRTLWAMHCVTCHGTQARGSETGPNIIRTKTVNFDRSAQQAGSVLGPFLKAGHPPQSGKASATFTDDEVVSLANFLRQRVNDTMRGSAVFTVGDILVGNARSGEAYFNGVGGCATCHTATALSLAGIATKYTPVDLQQRMLFPSTGRGGGRGAVNPNAVTVTISPAPTGPRVGAVNSISGVLVEESDFYVTVRQADGTIRVVRRGPNMMIVKKVPLQAHIDLLDRITDTQIHDLVAYLETMK